VIYLGITIEELEKLEEVLPKLSELVSSFEKVRNLEEFAIADEINEVLKEAEEAKTAEEVKAVLDKAVALLKEIQEKYPYPYPYPYPAPSTASEETKEENLEAEANEEVVEEENKEANEIEELKKEIEHWKVRAEELEKELLFEKRMKELAGIELEADKVKDIIIKMSDEEFEVYKQTLLKSTTKEVNSVVPERQNGNKSILALLKETTISGGEE